MSIRSDAALDYQYILAMPTANNVSWCGWIYIVNDRNAYGTILLMLADATHYQGVYLEATGTRLRVQMNPGTGSVGSTNTTDLSTGRWYHVAYTRNAAAHTVYLDGEVWIEYSNNISISPTTFVMGSNGADYLNGRMADMRAWSGAVLSQAEIRAEMASPTAVRTSNLWADWQTPAGAGRLNDSSGNGRNLSTGGTLADEDDPPYYMAARFMAHARLRQ